ncbi:hypothetical protein IMZ48_17290 [Candidatus Bathyarchaeota archaeon]|nr:hypothetical protein [Candidatus Bathyarchaeota archaeon]
MQKKGNGKTGSEMARDKDNAAATMRQKQADGEFFSPHPSHIRTARIAASGWGAIKSSRATGANCDAAEAKKAAEKK